MKKHSNEKICCCELYIFFDLKKRTFQIPGWMINNIPHFVDIILDMDLQLIMRSRTKLNSWKQIAFISIEIIMKQKSNIRYQIFV